MTTRRIYPSLRRLRRSARRTFSNLKMKSGSLRGPTLLILTTSSNYPISAMIIYEKPTKHFRARLIVDSTRSRNWRNPLMVTTRKPRKAPLKPKE